jgi:putative PIN family toxin of toxin-antitoxin system
MIIVPDTNLLIKGLIFRGDARQILNLAYSKKIKLYGSINSYKEMERVVNYSNFKKYLEKEIYTPDKLFLSYKALINIITINDEFKGIKVVIDDPDDDEFIRIAKTINSKIIISSDKHLIKIEKYEDIRIIEPEIFLKIYPTISNRKIR